MLIYNALHIIDLKRFLFSFVTGLRQRPGPTDSPRGGECASLKKNDYNKSKSIHILV